MTDQTFQGFGTPEQNWSKLPHTLIAALPTITTASELKVILYILRHTWGFHENEKRISLDEFANGRKKRGGERLDGGTGMSIPAIRNGIKRAIEHGFISVETDDSDKARIRKYYSLNQTVRKLQSDCKKVATRVKESCNRTKKETVETNSERHVATATPAPADAKDEPQLPASVVADIRESLSKSPCAVCGKLGATTADMPDVHNVCTCVQESVLSEHFGERPERAPPKPTPHWAVAEAEPWAQWGAQSDEFQGQLQTFDSNGRIVQRLGYELEQATGLHPLWSKREKVRGWCSGLWELYQEAGRSIETAIEAARVLRQGKMTTGSPYSFMKTARALAAEKKAPPLPSAGMAGGIDYS